MQTDTRASHRRRWSTITRAAAAVVSVGAVTLVSSPALAATHAGASWGTNSRTAPASDPTTAPTTPPTTAPTAAPVAASPQASGTRSSSVLSSDATAKAITPTNGVLMGAAAMGHAGMTQLSAFANLQTQTQHPFNLHRDYSSWGDPQPSAAVQWDIAHGLVPALSIVAKQGGKAVSWADIAAGKQDAEIIKVANALKATGKPILLTFHHEPENDPGNGTPADYRAAWRHYVSVFRADGATNVKFAWIMMGYSFSKKGFDPNAYYPGDDVIDWLGVDGYNFFGCTGTGGKTWKSFAQVFAPFRAFADQHPSKPIIIAEFGSQEDPANPGRKGQWLRDAATTLQGWTQVKAISYWNANMACSWYLDSSSTSLAGWRALVSDSALQPRFSNVATVNPPTVALSTPLTSQSSITVRGSVNPNGAATTYHVDYGTTSAYGQSSSPATVPVGSAASVSIPLTGLAAGTTYHVRLVAANSVGTTTTSDLAVSTVAAPARPQILGAVTALTTQTTATVSGSVRFFGLGGSYHVDYGTTNTYGHSTTPITVATGSDVVRFSALVSNLAAASTFHYRLVFSSASGTTTTADLQATTPRMVLPGHEGRVDPPPALWGWQTGWDRIHIWSASMAW